MLTNEKNGLMKKMDAFFNIDRKKHTYQITYYMEVLKNILLFALLITLALATAVVIVDSWLFIADIAHSRIWVLLVGKNTPDRIQTCNYALIALNVLTVIAIADGVMTYHAEKVGKIKTRIMDKFFKKLDQ